MPVTTNVHYWTLFLDNRLIYWNEYVITPRIASFPGKPAMIYFPKIVSLTHMWFVVLFPVGSSSSYEFNPMAANSLYVCCSWVLLKPWTLTFFFYLLYFLMLHFHAVGLASYGGYVLEAFSLTVVCHNNIILNTRFVMTGHNKYQNHFQWTPGNQIQLFTDFQVLQDWIYW